MHTGVFSHQRPRAPLPLWLVPAACLCCSSPASGQTPFSLSLLQPLAEDRAKVDVFSGANRAFARGRLLDVTDSSLVLEGRKGRMEVAAAEVREVWSPGGARYRTPVIVGTAVGLSFGLLAKAGEGDCRDPTSLCATDGPVTGTDMAIVTAIGASSGLGWAWWKRRPRHLLYLSSEAMAEMGPPPDASSPVPVAAPPGWQELTGLQGRTVEVASRGSGTTLTGTLLGVTPRTLQLLVAGEPYIIPQPEVRRVWSEPRVPWWSVIAGSLYYGLPWGAVIAAVSCSSGPEPDEWSACESQALGITIGAYAAIFTVAVAKQRHDALVYDRSRPVAAASSSVTLQPLVSPRAVGIRGAFTF
jgi:hypothetical protein